MVFIGIAGREDSNMKELCERIAAPLSFAKYTYSIIDADSVAEMHEDGYYYGDITLTEALTRSCQADSVDDTPFSALAAANVVFVYGKYVLADNDLYAKLCLSIFIDVDADTILTRYLRRMTKNGMEIADATASYVVERCDAERRISSARKKAGVVIMNESTASISAAIAACIGSAVMYYGGSF